MTRDESVMTCEDVGKRLMLFLDDLLAEDEFEAFRSHIGMCGQCNAYVRSIGSLSNQLWKLGAVRVPEDLEATIAYKLSRPEERDQPIRYTIPVKYIAAVILLIAAAAFFGVKYSKSARFSRAAESSPVVVTEAFRQPQQTPGDTEPQALVRQLETIAEGLDVSVKDAPPAKEPPAQPPAVVAAKTDPLHWHFRAAGDGARGDKLFGILAAADIRPDYREGGMLIFTAAGKQIRNVVERILLLPAVTYEDFTQSAITSREESRKVSIYFGQDTRGALHWHVTLRSGDMKAELLAGIGELGGSIDYASEEITVISLPDAELNNARGRARAMAASLDEYGSAGSRNGSLRSGPVTISIYFTK